MIKEHIKFVKYILFYNNVLLQSFFRLYQSSSSHGKESTSKAKNKKVKWSQSLQTSLSSC